ncbi:MAG: hypothetical protein E7018_01890 [Alphaproteobacteria bacterium]|nr:hypothetical protein [Alphaproteobacteria bacterium]
MADISLTASMRSNLLSLQNTQGLMDLTQERLSTGKKVNSAIDNPASYYTARSLNNRASDLNALLDSMGQGIQTIKAATEGIEAITTFVEQAKAIVNSALDVSPDAGAVSPRKGIETTGTFKDGTGVDDKGTPDTADDVAKETEVEFTLKYGDDTKTIKINDIRDGVTTIGAGKTAEDVLAERLQEELRDSGVAGAAGFTVTVNKGQLSVTNSNEDVAFTLSGTVNGLSITATAAAIDPNAPKNDREVYQQQYNEVLNQITALAEDAGYKGVNLLQEENLTVKFNEDSSNFLEVKGHKADVEGLGLVEDATWTDNTELEQVLQSVTDAINTLRNWSADLGNNYSIIQNREDFTEKLVNVLTEGADKLTLADMNEESANMLALQTRQQLAINSLSLASQAAQGVLKLF